MFFTKTDILIYVLEIPAILFALTIHEFSHGFIAYKLGDPTAKNMGRLTLNPLKHIEPIGFGMMIIVGFGWARPVPINSRYFKKPRRDMALTAAAGPVANLLLAFVSMILLNFVSLIRTVENSTWYYIVYALYMFLYILAELNVVLAIFNLIPIPPLDGSKILFMFLPAKWYYKIIKYERYITIGFFVVFLLFGRLARYLGIPSILGIVSGWVLNGMQSLLSLIPIFR